MDDADFDLRALYEALDDERRARGMTWATVAREVNRLRTTRRAISSSTMHAALDAERKARNLTWTEVASQVGGFTTGMLTQLARGGRIGFPRVMRLTRWLGQPAVNFTCIADW